ncbi:MAG: hypothetical protein HWD60_10410 [Defluviicoccus sp.]|nr:MAG: hypothetical protein HWD60_10410 [Defluviicoccus sp.]
MFNLCLPSGIILPILSEAFARWQAERSPGRGGSRLIGAKIGALLAIASNGLAKVLL